MDGLELLKKDWKKQDDSLPKLSYNDIYSMILKKSSSIVRSIFIISVLEFVLWASLEVILRMSDTYGRIKMVGMETISIIASVLSYSILIYYMVLFYKNYKKIQATDSTKVLMENILKTRKAVRQYVLVILGFMSVFMILVFSYMIFIDSDANQHFMKDKELPKAVLFVMVLIFTGIILGTFALFYRLIYGVLTRKLKKNYSELERLEV
ncbi:hypothetical protein ACFSTE_16225 [Aquimarina hainanensis]|uniref:Uncharacterized protein n=2 Tax=Aquimarina hainanensis TaxID=1578017 RepID=A0ABW5N9T7_9FLAO